MKLDVDGLRRLISDLKPYFAKKQDRLKVDETVSLVKNQLSVTTPVRDIFTQDEFDALPEEERNKGFYVIDDGDVGGGNDEGSSGGPSLDIYSTEETRIGTWIDGRPLYRKVIQLGSSLLPGSSYGEYVYGADIPDLRQLIGIRGFFYRDRDYINQLIFPFNSYVVNQFNIGLYVDALNSNNGVLNIILKNSVSSSITIYNSYIILEYTKTTDEPEVTR